MTNFTRRIAEQHNMNVLGGCMDCLVEPEGAPLQGYALHQWFHEHIIEATVSEIVQEIRSAADTADFYHQGDRPDAYVLRQLANRIEEGVEDESS